MDFSISRQVSTEFRNALRVCGTSKPKWTPALVVVVESELVKTVEPASVMVVEPVLADEPVLVVVEEPAPIVDW